MDLFLYLLTGCWEWGELHIAARLGWESNSGLRMHYQYYHYQARHVANLWNIVGLEPWTLFWKSRWHFLNFFLTFKGLNASLSVHAFLALIVLTLSLERVVMIIAIVLFWRQRWSTGWSWEHLCIVTSLSWSEWRPGLEQHPASQPVSHWLRTVIYKVNSSLRRLETRDWDNRYSGKVFVYLFYKQPSPWTFLQSNLQASHLVKFHILTHLKHIWYHWFNTKNLRILGVTKHSCMNHLT